MYITDLNKELENCTFVKCILMFGVLIYHSIVFWNGSWFTVIEVKEKSIVLSVLSLYLNSFHIYCFTLVSGYIYSFLKYERNKYSRFPDFAKTKVKRLLVPYFFISVTWVIPINNYFYNYSLNEVVERFIYATAPSQLWFLWMLFDVFIIIWPLSELLKNDKIALAVSLFSFCLGTIFNTLKVFNLFSFITALNYLPFFVLGMKIREKKSWFIRKISLLQYLVFDILLFVSWYITLSKDGRVFAFIRIGIGVLLNIVGALTAFFLLQKAASMFDWKNKRLIMSFSDKSMAIYLLHQQIIYISIYLVNGLVNPYVNGIINILVSLSISFVLSLLLSRFRITRLLIGEK